MIDELSHLAEIDPLEYRLKLITDSPKHKAVLELLQNNHTGEAHYLRVMGGELQSTTGSLLTKKLPLLRKLLKSHSQIEAS